MPTIQLPIVASLDADGNKIINLGTPTGDADAATKAYVDGINSGLSTGLIRRQVSGTGYQVGDTVWNTVGIYTSRSSNNTDATTNTNSWTEIATFTHSSQVALITTNRNNIATLNNQVGPIADPFSETATYVEDAQVWFENKLYIANANINTAGAFVPAQWTVVGSGTGINTGLTLGTTSTTALAGNSTTDNIAEGVTNLYYTTTRVNALITSRSITEYSPSAAYNGGEHLIVSTGLNRGLYEVLQAIQANSGILITSVANFVKRTAFLTDAQVAQISTNTSNLNTHAASTTNPHQVTGAQVGVGFKADTYVELLGDTTNIKRPGTVGVVANAVLFDISASTPSTSRLQVAVGGANFTYIAVGVAATSTYTLSFPQEPVGNPFIVNDRISFFVIPDGGGLTVGHHAVLVEGATITSQTTSFGNLGAIATEVTLTSAQFNAIKGATGVNSQESSGIEILGIPTNQIYAYETSSSAPAVPTHEVESYYIYRGATQTTGATTASEWIEKDVPGNTVRPTAIIDTSDLITDSDILTNASGQITGFTVGGTNTNIASASSTGPSDRIILTGIGNTPTTRERRSVELTRAEYTAKVVAGTTVANTVYDITDDPVSTGGGGVAPTSAETLTALNGATGSIDGDLLGNAPGANAAVTTIATFVPGYINPASPVVTNLAFAQVNTMGNIRTVEVWLGFNNSSTNTNNFVMQMPATDTDGNAIPRPRQEQIGDSRSESTAVHYSVINTTGQITLMNGAEVLRRYSDLGTQPVYIYIKYIAVA